MKLFRPVSVPINQSNLFGTPSAMYTALKQKGHPGLDFEAPTGTPIYAPCDGQAVYATDTLHGDGIWIRATDENGQNYNVILWHMPSPSSNPPEGVASASQYPFKIPTDGTFVAVKTGQLLGYTDNSGYNPIASESETTGPHLHLGVMPADKNWNALSPNNGYLGCVDPMPFLSTILAENYQELQDTTQAAAAVTAEVAASNLPLQTKQDYFAKVGSFLSWILKTLYG